MTAPASAMAEPPLVSIVTPSFNYGRFLGDCLESVGAQTHPRIEHLVLDALSTDESGEVIRSFAARRPIAAFFETDRGQADALNKGFARARGEVLAWLNADDYYLHAGVVAEVVEIFARHPEVDVVTGAGTYVDERGRPTRAIRPRPERTVRELAYYDTFLQPATFWRRRVHRRLDDRLRYAFDWKLFLEQVRAGATVHVAPNAWAAYRLHGVNKSAADPAARRLEIAEILREVHGPGSPQHLWALAVHRAFAVAEARRLAPLKRAALLANAAVFHLSRRRVVS